MMTPFRYCDSSDVIVTLFITIFYIYLIQLWRSFFQIFVDGNALYAQTQEVLTLKKKTIEPHLKSSFLILSYQDFSVALWAGGGIDCSFLLMRMIFSIHCSYSAFILASVRKQVAICHLRNERRLGRANLRKAFWDCYC